MGCLVGCNEEMVELNFPVGKQVILRVKYLIGLISLRAAWSWELKRLIRLVVDMQDYVMDDWTEFCWVTCTVTTM